MKKNTRKVIAIVGTTASGKTGIGVRLAKEFNGEIISADSRQVYRGLDIGTGKEGLLAEQLVESRKLKVESQIKELRSHCRYVDGVPQWMIDIVEPGEKMTLFDYLPLARRAIEDIFSRGKLPIIVGGTGLYVQGLVEGFQLEYHPYTPPKIGGEWGGMTREQLDQLTVKQLNDILHTIDSEKSEKVDKKNRHRLIRAIELAQEGLKPTKVKPDFEVLQIGIDIPRAELHERIDKRVDERFKNGMLEEVIHLIESGVDTDWLVGLGLEYKVMTEFLLKTAQLFHCSIVDLPPLTPPRLGGECNYSPPKVGGARGGMHNEAMKQCSNEFENMKQVLKFRIHQFARRQLTWFRRFPEINWLSDYKEIKRFVRIFLEH